MIVVTKREIRLAKLTQLLEENGRLHLREAAEQLAVSEMTVRRDITSNPRAFVYLGGNILLAPTRGGYNLSNENASLTEAKSRASRNALALIKPNSTIFIDSGTTLLHLATLLPLDTELTVVTCSLNVATRLGDRPNIRLVLLGGLYHPASDCFIADGLADSLANMGISQAFLSAGGYDPDRGASCYQLHEAQIKSLVVKHSSKRYLVVDSSKVGILRPFVFAQPGILDAVVTEADTDSISS